MNRSVLPFLLSFLTTEEYLVPVYSYVLTVLCHPGIFPGILVSDTPD